MEPTCQGGNPSSAFAPVAEPNTQKPSTSDNASNYEEKGGLDPEPQGDLSGENGKKSPKFIKRADDDPLALAEKSDDGYSSDNKMSASLLSDEDHERDQLRFSVNTMNTDKMFKAYKMRLERHDQKESDQEASDQEESEHEKFEPKESPMGTAMMRGIMSYTKSLEGRIVKLEATKRGSRTQRLAGDGNDKVRTEKPATVSNELLLEVQFFDVNYEPEFSGHCLEERDVARGPYRSATGPKQLIRVLYNWRENISRRSLPPGQSPLPGEIDVTGLGIWSEPIIAFFKRRLNIRTPGISALVRIEKPFQPLLRNLDIIRGQLSMLERVYK